MQWLVGGVVCIWSYDISCIETPLIGSITWSDHVLLGLTYTLTDTSTAPNRSWRLNESLLQDQDELADVVKELGNYFHINATPDCAKGTVWEAHKAVIRGGAY